MADWPVFVINLDRDRSRLGKVSAELSRAGVTWTRLPAVDGRALTPREVASVYDAEANRVRARQPMTLPEIGAYLSHIRAWEAIVASGAPGGVVLEDDIRVTGDLKGTLSALAADDGDWTLGKLFTFRPGQWLLDDRWLAPGIRIGTPYHVPDGAPGYVLRAKTASLLIARSRRFFRPVDQDHKFFWESGLSVALVRPVPITLALQDAPVESAGPTVGGEAGPGILRTWRALRHDLRYAMALRRARRGGL
ncbi:glycosyl transferase family 25 [Rhodobacterales bacterium HKCCE3408]|nr:glycosyl transferase family 25 [Rhodobacterales bacterium HKCCE3408]